MIVPALGVASAALLKLVTRVPEHELDMAVNVAPPPSSTTYWPETPETVAVSCSPGTNVPPQLLPWKAELPPDLTELPMMLCPTSSDRLHDRYEGYACAVAVSSSTAVGRTDRYEGYACAVVASSSTAAGRTDGRRMVQNLPVRFS